MQQDRLVHWMLHKDKHRALATHCHREAGRCIKTHIPVVEHLCVVKSFGCYVLTTWQQKLESKYTILTNLLEDHRHEGDGWSEKQPKDCLHQHFEVQKNSSTVSCSSES